MSDVFSIILIMCKLYAKSREQSMRPVNSQRDRDERELEISERTLENMYEKYDFHKAGYFSQKLTSSPDLSSRNIPCVTHKVNCFLGEKDFHFFVASSSCNQSGIQPRFNEGCFVKQIMSACLYTMSKS